jgi:predicted ribosome quality control (RQC) complex YloA/Tae2 family protein
MPKESLRYLQNAKELLGKSAIEDNVYTDIKYVREACSTAYLAILIAIDEYLLNQGVSKKELPKSVDAYRDKIKKYLSVHNGKLMNRFEGLYDELHIAGYYRGLLRDVNVIKEVFKNAKVFIEKIG